MTVGAARSATAAPPRATKSAWNDQRSQREPRDSPAAACDAARWAASAMDEPPRPAAEHVEDDDEGKHAGEENHRQGRRQREVVDLQGLLVDVERHEHVPPAA